MLKKSRLKSQTPLAFQAFFSKINGFSSKKSLFQRFSLFLKTFLAMIFLTTVAKIGVTPIFAGECASGEYTCSYKNDHYYEPIFNCNASTGATAFSDPSKGASGCPNTTTQTCYQKCGQPVDKSNDFWFSCCREKNLEEICNKASTSGGVTSTAGTITNTEICSAFNGSILAQDSNNNVCCNLKFNNQTNLTFQTYCTSLSNNKFYTYSTQNSCDSGDTSLGSIVFSVPGGFIPTVLVYSCCATSLENADFDQVCQDRSNFFNIRLPVYQAVYESDTKKLVCNDGDAIFFTNEDQTKGCCQKLTDLPEVPKPPDSLILNINVNHLKFQSLLDMNPLQNSSVFSDPDSRTPGNIINQALTAVVFPIAGVGLIILILWGGFQVLSGSLSGKQNNIDLGKKRVTAAIVGFILLFLIYWIWRLIALATGLSV